MLLLLLLLLLQRLLLTRMCMLFPPSESLGRMLAGSLALSCASDDKACLFAAFTAGTRKAALAIVTASAQLPQVQGLHMGSG